MAHRLAPIRWTRADIAQGHSPPADWSWSWKDCWWRAYERATSFEYKYSDRRPILDLGELNWLDEIVTNPDLVGQRAEEMKVKLEAAKAQRTAQPPKPKPSSKRKRRDAAAAAAELGVSAYDWTDEHGTKHHVRGGGTGVSLG
jgi:hypothetical protein